MTILFDIISTIGVLILAILAVVGPPVLVILILSCGKD